MKDREKEEYTSGILREKGSVAERPLIGKMWKVALELFCRRASCSDACVGENGRSRYRPVECPSVLVGNKGGTASFRPFYGRRLLFFMAFHGGFTL